MKIKKWLDFKAQEVDDYPMIGSSPLLQVNCNCLSQWWHQEMKFKAILGSTVSTWFVIRKQTAYMDSDKKPITGKEGVLQNRMKYWERKKRAWKCFLQILPSQYSPLSMIIFSTCLVRIIVAISYCSAYSCSSHQPICTLQIGGYFYTADRRMFLNCSTMFTSYPLHLN